MLMQKEKYSYSFVFIAFSFIALGVFLRAWHYILNRSLWVDEAMLALNIVHRSFLELTHPLDYDQGAPLGFLFIEKIIILIFGNREYTLRLIPLISGLSSLFLMYKATRKYIGLRVTPIAMGLFALSTPLIFYASDVKQYSSDALISIILLVVAFDCFSEKASNKNYIILGVLGSFSLWFSHPALFVLAGIGCTLALDTFCRKNKPRYIWVVGIGLLWLVSFCSLYFISLQFLAKNKVLINCWSSSFMPMPPWHNAVWFYDRFLHLLNYSFGPSNIYIIKICGILSFVGLCSLFARKWQFGIILTITFVTLLLASGLQKYPVTERFLLFCVPIMIFLLSEGIERSYQILHKCHYSLAIGGWLVLGFLLIATPVRISYYKFNDPNMMEHIKPVLAYLEKHRKPSDLIYVYYGALPALEYYADMYGIKKSDYIEGRESRDHPEEYQKDIYKLKGHERVWFLFSHDFAPNRNSPPERISIGDHLKKIGTSIDGFRSTGSSVSLFDLTRPDMGQEITPALSYIAEHRKATDIIYVYYGALDAYDYYGPSYGLQPNNHIAGIQSRQHPEKYIEDIDKLKENKRVWFVFYHDYASNRHEVSEQAYILRHLNTIGTNKDKLEMPACAAYLFDLSE